MKTQMILLFLLLVSIPVFTQAETLFDTDLSGIELSDIFVEYDGIGASPSVHYLLYAKESGEIKQFQTFDVESRKQRVERPPLNDGRVTGEILAGGVGGIALGIAGGYIGADLAKGCSGGFCSLEEIFIGFSIGYTLGSSIGVYVVGNIGNETGSFEATLVGTFIGGLVLSIGGAVLVSEVFQDTPDDVLIGIVLAGPPIGATIGFNLSRRYKSHPASETALINFTEGQVSLSAPTISFRPNPYVDLVKVGF